MPTRTRLMTCQSYVLRPRRPKRWILLFILVLMIAGHWWWGARAERKFEKVVAALHRHGEPTSPHQFRPADDVPDSDNAARAIEAAAFQVNGDWTEDVALLDLQLPLTERESCLLETHVAANLEPISSLRRGRERRRAALDVDWQTPMAFIAPPLTGHADLRMLLNARAILSHHGGNDRDALECVRDLLFFSRVTASLPLHYGLYGTSTHPADVAIAVAPELRVSPHETADDTSAPAPPALVADVIEALLDEAHAREGAKLALRARRVAIIEACQLLANGKLGLDDLVHVCGGTMPSANGYLFKPLILRDGVLIVHECTRVIEVLDQPSLPAFRAAAPCWIKGSWRRPYAAMLAPHYDDLMARYYEALATRRVAAAALAVRWYQSEHDGQFPEGLSALVPRYLPAVPLDPMANGDKPLTYVPHGPLPRIYSVGRDGNDDDGLSDPLLIDTGVKDIIGNLRRQPRDDRDRGYEQFVREVYGDTTSH